MFPQVNSNTNSLQLFEADMTSLTGRPLATGLGLMTDHSLTIDFQCPQSPNSQYMYETDTDAFITNCSTGIIKQSPSTSQLTSGPVCQYLDYDVISPSVERLTFDSNDILSYTYNGRGENELPKSEDNVLKIIDNGPTLTQLNTEDLGSSFFDDFDGFNDFGTAPVFDCTKLVNRDREPMKYTTCIVTPPLSSSLVASSNWPQQTLLVGTPIILSSAVNNHSAGALSAVSNGYSFTNNGINTAEMCQPAVAATTAATMKRPLSPQPVHKSSVLANAETSPKTSANWNWEEIESFLRSEGQRMATEASNSSPVEPVAKKIKTEPITDTAEIVSEETCIKTEDDANDDDDDDDESGLSDNELSYNDEDEGDDDQLGFLIDSVSTSRKEKTYFWQYNTQSKGPKGKRLCKAVQDDDPYILHDFEDPVFDADLQAMASPRYRHSGKARRGDGNDVTPNPGKLFATGKELRKLAQLISRMTPSADMSAAVRARTLREKNKYASRVCRLKKKAQHEANKIKLHGLEQEHRQLIKVLTAIRKEMIQRVRNPLCSDGEKLSARLDSLIKTHLTVMTAGHTTEYVNSVLAKVATGDRSGGLVYDEC